MISARSCVPPLPPGPDYETVPLDGDEVRHDLYAPVFAATPGQPPNLYADYLPSDLHDVMRWSGEHMGPLPAKGNA